MRYTEIFFDFLLLFPRTTHPEQTWNIMMAMTLKFRQHCVPGRCRICRYLLQDGDEIRIPTNSRPMDTDYQRGLKWRLKNFERFEEYWFCNEAECDHKNNDGPLPAFHRWCYSNGRLDCMFFAAIEYTFEPMPQVDRIRQQNIRDSFINSVLIPSFLGRLPYEILVMVSDYLIVQIRQFAVKEIESIYSARQGYGAQSSIDMSKSVWARYILIEGVAYIEHLSNFPAPGFRQVFDADSAPRVNLLYILVDHLGVRKLAGANGANNPLDEKTDPGSWWRVISNRRGIKEVQAVFDGLKIRNISFGSRRAKTTKLLPEPMKPSTLRDCVLWRAAEKNVRFIPFRMNGPDVTGYSFCWSQGLIHMQVHRREDHYNIYRDFDALLARPIWVFLPTGPGEYISQILIEKYHRRNVAAFMFVTNTNYAANVGPGPFLNRRGKHPSILIQLDSKETTLYFNQSIRGIRRIMRPKGDEHKLPLQLIEVSDPMMDYETFRSCAPVAGIKEIVVCRDRRFDWAITGLLLDYYDGSRACLGHFRFDSTVRPGYRLPPEGIEALYIGKRSRNRFNPVVAIATSLPDPRLGDESVVGFWRGIPFKPPRDDSGDLELCCKLHAGSASMDLFAVMRSKQVCSIPRLVPGLEFDVV